MVQVVGGKAVQPTEARAALAENLKHLMSTYQKGFAVGLTPVELQKGSGVSAKTIRRMIDPYADTGPTLGNIDAIAEFFRVQTWELLRRRSPLLQISDPQPPSPPAPRNNRRISG